MLTISLIKILQLWYHEEYHVLWKLKAIKYL